MENNPELVQGPRDVAYRDPNTTITRQPLVGGGEVYEGTKQPDVEAGPQDTGVSGAQGTTTTTSKEQYPVTTTTTTTAPAEQRQPRRSSTGWIGNFATRSRGRFFFPLHAGIVFFSFLVLVSAAQLENLSPAAEGLRFVQYQLMIGQLSFAVSLAACVMERLGFVEHPNVRVALSAFQVFFWVPALAIITFFGSFVTPLLTPNGFFGVWGATACAGVIFCHETERFRRDPRNTSAPRTSLLLLFFFSLAIMGAGIRLHARTEVIPNDVTLFSGWSYVIFSIVFGAVTAGVSVFLLIIVDAIPHALMMTLCTILWFWVAASILILTFADPFEVAIGNGYYACLFALIAAFGLISSYTYVSTDNTRSGNAADRNANVGRSFFTFVRGGAFASLVVMVAAIRVCRFNDGCQGRMQQWQVAAGAVSLGLALIVMILEFVDTFRTSAVFKTLFSFIWLLWWIAAFITLTWYGTFQSPTFGGVNTPTQPIGGVYANGFFFTWVALIMAALAFVQALKDSASLSDPPSHVTAKSGFLVVIIIGSLITMGSGIKWYYDTDFSLLSKYAIALGTVSVGLTIILFLILAAFRTNYEAHDSLYNAGLYLLTFWWAVGALVVTYDGLWTSANDNGYFSVFFNLGACLLALSGFWRMDDDDRYHRDSHDDYNTGRNYHAASDPHAQPAYNTGQTTGQTAYNTGQPVYNTAATNQPYTATATTTVNRY